MTASMPFDIGEFFSGYMAQLQAEAEYFSASISHAGEKGRLNETHIANILRRYLPKRFGIGTGFIASTNSKKPKSPQCDIIIYDALNNAPLYDSEAFGVYPIEMVYAVIEVKTNLRTELESCLEKCAFIREMTKELVSPEEFKQRMKEGAGNFGFEEGDHRGRKMILHKGYLKQMEENGVVGVARYFSKLPPRFFVFAYDGWRKPETLATKFKELGAKHPRAHLHGVCVLNSKGGYFTKNLAYRTGDQRYAPVVAHDGFMTFLLTLPETLDSMLPAHPHRMGSGFDMVNLARYRIPAAEAGTDMAANTGSTQRAVQAGKTKRSRQRRVKKKD